VWYSTHVKLLTTKGFPDYELIDSGDQMRLERFGAFTVSRPDPQAIWKPTLPQKQWEQAHATFVRSNAKGGEWKMRVPIPTTWPIHYKKILLNARLTPFKHTGIFPEQHQQWDAITALIQNATGRAEPVRVLNLFGYTGGMTLTAAAAGAHVTHVDASKPAITWAHDNAHSSGLSEAPIRWIPDDALKFVERDIRRGAQYDIIIMDPPVYGHGPKGEAWDFNTHFPKLIEGCAQLLSPNALALLVNTYAISSSALMLENVLKGALSKRAGKIECGELVLEERSGRRNLSTGIYGMWNA
jgi:23S rRNA (cytosine1962-C5)-methyltransferase